MTNNAEFNFQLAQREALGALLTGSKYSKVRVEALNTWTGETYNVEVKNGQLERISGISYLTDWNINVYDEIGTKILENIKNNYSNKIIGINLATGALGDTLSWTGSVLKFYEKHKPKKIYIATSWSNLFDKTKYPSDMIFLDRAFLNENRVYPLDCDTLHLLGISREHETIDSMRENHATPCNWKTTNMVDTENFALGVETGAIRPHLIPLPPERLIQKPYVTICNNTTQKVKHILSNKVWMSLVEEIKKMGLEVVHVGNTQSFFPGVTDGCSDDIRVAMRFIRDAEFHIGLSSGLSWMAWAYSKHVLMLSNFTHEGYEFIEGNTRILNNMVSYGHFNNMKFPWEPTWSFDPDKDDLEQSCRSFTPEMVLMGLKELLRKKNSNSMEGTYLDMKSGGVFKPIKPLYPKKYPSIYEEVDGVIRLKKGQDK